MVSQVPFGRISFRRFTFKDRCPTPCINEWGHNASSIFQDSVPWTSEYHGWGYLPSEQYPKSRPEWPKKCERCEYLFQDQDEWQVNGEQYWEATDGQKWVLRELPPGAMFWGDWGPQIKVHPALHVMLPDKAAASSTPWCIDGTATGGGYWERTGEPPNITVKPSILSGEYHAFLTNGVLQEV